MTSILKLLVEVVVVKAPTYVWKTKETATRILNANLTCFVEQPMDLMTIVMVTRAFPIHLIAVMILTNVSKAKSLYSIVW